MPGKEERRAARQLVGDYYQAQLAQLLEHVAEAVDRFRAGDIDPFEADEVMFRYSRAAKELWKFCNVVSPDVVASSIQQGEDIDWWERGRPRRRG